MKITNAKSEKLFVNVMGQSSGIGKSLFADRTRAHLKTRGFNVKLFRVEAERNNLRLLEGDHHINTREIANSAKKMGGLLDIFSPVTDHLFGVADSESPECILIDWGAGNFNHAMQIYLEAGLEDELEEFGFVNFMFIVSTLQVSHLKEACGMRKKVSEALPTFKTVGVINERDFSIDQIATTSRSEFDTLRSEFGDGGVLRMPLIGRRAAEMFCNLDHDFEAIMGADTHRLVELTGLNFIVLKSGQTRLRIFRDQMEEQLDAVFPFRKSPIADARPENAKSE